MIPPESPKPEEYWRNLEPHLPRFSTEEQRVAIALYRELAKGRPVDAAQLGQALGISSEEAGAFLQRPSIACFVHRDAQGHIVGFGGLATTPMHHRFEVDGRSLSTWCAWDALFIPEILGRSARVTSADPENGVAVHLVVKPDGIEAAEPPDAVMSFVVTDDQVFNQSADNVMAKFCHYIYFFSSRASGERWAARHPGTFLYSLDDACTLAKRFNARNFKANLAPPR